MHINNAAAFLVDYFKGGEKSTDDFKIGVECEHIIVFADTLETIPYNGERSLLKLLEYMSAKGWSKVYEGNNVVGLEKDGSTVSLEPAGQLEISISPQKDLIASSKIYLDFIEDILGFLDRNNLLAVSLGYHPQSCISNLKLVPKKRYYYLHRYLSKKGRYAVNMMKGTAACHVCIDYGSESDYVKKSRVAAWLSPLIYAMTDNAPFFEGTVWDKHSARSFVWDNCDSERCGLPEKIFSADFGYMAYAEYLLERPPILIKNNGMLKYSSSRKLKYLCEKGIIDFDGLLYSTTMYFPDVRTRNYLEIRMADSLPYPYNFGYAAFWKGLLYDSANLDRLYEESLKYGYKDYYELKHSIINKGIYATMGNISIKDKMKELLKMSKNALDKTDYTLLVALEDLIDKFGAPKNIILKMLPYGKQNALRYFASYPKLLESLNQNILPSSVIQLMP